jgi:hypothetical protein
MFGERRPPVSRGKKLSLNLSRKPEGNLKAVLFAANVLSLCCVKR